LPIWSQKVKFSKGKRRKRPSVKTTNRLFQEKTKADSPSSKVRQAFQRRKGQLGHSQSGAATRLARLAGVPPVKLHAISLERRDKIFWKNHGAPMLALQAET
jgi:hypothetical protein